MVNKTMFILIEPVISLTSFCVLSCILFWFFCQIPRQKKPGNTQMNLQLLTVFSIVAFMVYQYVCLKTSYKHKVWEYDIAYKVRSHKIFQMISENLIKSISILSITLMLDSRMNSRIDESFHKRLTLYAYSIFRWVPISYIMAMVKKDYNFYILLGETLSISESVVLAILFGALLSYLHGYNSDNIEIDMQTLRILSKNSNSCATIMIGFVFEIIYRLGFLTLAAQDQTRTMLFLKDFLNITRIVSFSSILIGTIGILFRGGSSSPLLDVRSVLDAGKSCDSDFFIYEEPMEEYGGSEFDINENSLQKLLK